jgi:hypothetical protein
MAASDGPRCFGTVAQVKNTITTVTVSVITMIDMA